LFVFVSAQGFFFFAVQEYSNNKLVIEEQPDNISDTGASLSSRNDLDDEDVDAFDSDNTDDTTSNIKLLHPRESKSGLMKIQIPQPPATHLILPFFLLVLSGTLMLFVTTMV
jgi:hypothetical protein